MSGVQDIKLIADTAVFSIISICLTPYSDVGAHSRTSCLGLRTNQAYLHMVPSKWPIPQNHSPNGFSVFEFRIKIQLFNYHIYSVALAYLQMHCRQYSFVDWFFFKYPIYNDYWGHKARVMKIQMSICEISFAASLFCPQIEHIGSDKKVRIKLR